MKGVIMLKRYLLSVVVVFVLWTAFDFVVHGVILNSAYQDTAKLWRPMPEMKMGLMRLITFILAMIFVSIYTLLINPKSLKIGALFGLLMGLVSGISMGLGSYCYMPITMYIAVVWFVSSIIVTILAGLCVGAIVKK